MDNPHNVLITKTQVEDILNYFGPIGNGGTRLKINTIDYYQTAFVHESYYQVQQQNLDKDIPVYINYIASKSNESLEYLGDHVLKSSLGRYMYKRFGDCREGFLTRLKIKIEKCSMLHQFAITLGFKKYLLLSLQIENQSLLDFDRGRSTPSFYEDAFEAFLGAIMEDYDEQGYIYADRFIKNIIENVIDFSELISQNDNFKDSLQRFFQSLKWKTPQYIELNKEGPLYRIVFTRILYTTTEQFDNLDNIQKDNIKRYTQECLEYYKTQNITIYKTLFEKCGGGNYILALGNQRKVTSSEQMCAQQALENLNLDQNY
jgi:dsRNA-specific ribonuclease